MILTSRIEYDINGRKGAITVLTSTIIRIVDLRGNINSVEGSDYERGNCQIQIHGGEKRKRIIRNDATAILVFHPL
ncbi:hypothetical protein BT69DRAFT_1286574, partial [Atractiella rhizophila]